MSRIKILLNPIQYFNDYNYCFVSSFEADDDYLIVAFMFISEQRVMSHKDFIQFY